MAIVLKQAVEAAHAFLKEAIGYTSDVRLEEVEQSDDRRFWLITLGYSESSISVTRTYKQFKVDKDSGEVISMKIRLP